MTPSPKQPPLERYVRILELLASFPDGLGLADIARMLGLPKASAHRLLGSMQDAQLIGWGQGGHYLLGNRIKRLAYLGAGTEWVATVVRPHLADLALQTEETCYLARLDGIEVSSMLMEAPDTPWRGFVLPGKSMPPHAAASGKAILAFQPPEVIEAVLSQPLPRLASKTRTDPDEIRAEYAQVRAQGYATCIAEIDDGLAALGVPVHVPHLGVVYSLGITGPLQRVLEKGIPRLVTIMQTQAAHVSQALAAGYAKRPEP